MAESRDRSAEIHMRDGVLRRGRVVARADEKGRIRESNGRLFKERELGHIDSKNRVRRRREGLVGQGEVIARIRGNGLYESKGVLRAARKWGWIDADGNVVQADCAAFEGRVIGRARGADPESALAYFALKFSALEDHVAVLEEKVDHSSDKYAFLPRVRAIQRILPTVDGLGDFDDLASRLMDLEESCGGELTSHLREEGRRVKSLRGIVKKWTRIPSLESVRNELTTPAEERIEQAEALVSRVRDEIERLRNDPETGADEIWESVRDTVTSLVEVRELTALQAGEPPRLPPSTAIAEGEDQADAQGRTRAFIDGVLDSPPAQQVLTAVDGAITALEALQSARDDGLQALSDAVDEARGGLGALVDARDAGVSGLKQALLALRGDRLEELEELEVEEPPR